MTRTIAPSELIVNSDGSVFHLHLRPEQLARTVILVGDPGRVEQVASRFDRIEHRAANREFVTATGYYAGKRMTVLSTGIGTDNIDIVVNELDALVNIDLRTRTEKEEKTRLTLVRLGTCGAIRPELRLGDRILSRISVGLDGLLNFYEGSEAVCDREMERAFVEHTGWNSRLATPYFVRCSDYLAELFAPDTVEGMTASAPGFYAPQGRYLRLAPADRRLNEKIESFEYGGHRFTNFEMEGSALAGLSRRAVRAGYRRGHDSLGAGILCPARTLPEAGAGRQAPERENRVVRVRRPPLHEFRDGRLRAGRTLSSDGARCRHDLHGDRPTGRARIRHRLSAVC